MPQRSSWESKLLTVVAVVVPVVGLTITIYKLTTSPVPITPDDQFKLTIGIAAVLCFYMFFTARESWYRRNDATKELELIHAALNKIRKSLLFGDTYDIDDYYPTLTKCIGECIEDGSFAGGGYAISLTSFRKDNPLEDKDPDCIAYHAMINKCVDNNIAIRRLVSVTTEKKWAWVKHMSRFQRDRRFELRLYPDVKLLSSVSIPPLNVQLVGKRDVFVVHAESGKDRVGKFTHLRSEKVYDMFKRYYGEIWGACETWTFINGRQVNSDFINESYEGFRKALLSADATKAADSATK